MLAKLQLDTPHLNRLDDRGFPALYPPYTVIIPVLYEGREIGQVSLDLSSVSGWEPDYDLDEWVEDNTGEQILGGGTLEALLEDVETAIDRKARGV